MGRHTVVRDPTSLGRSTAVSECFNPASIISGESCRAVEKFCFSHRNQRGAAPFRGGAAPFVKMGTAQAWVVSMPDEDERNDEKASK